MTLQKDHVKQIDKYIRKGGCITKLQDEVVVDTSIIKGQTRFHYNKSKD